MLVSSLVLCSIFFNGAEARARPKNLLDHLSANRKPEVEVGPDGEVVADRNNFTEGELGKYWGSFDIGASCDIDKRDSLTYQEFEADYASKGLPVIVRGLTSEWSANYWVNNKTGDLSEHIAWMQKWTKTNEEANRQLRDSSTGIAPVDLKYANSYIDIDQQDLRTQSAIFNGFELPGLFARDYLDEVALSEDCFERQRDSEHATHVFSSAARSCCYPHPCILSRPRTPFSSNRFATPRCQSSGSWCL
jgi:hypothetical protein